MPKVSVIIPTHNRAKLLPIAVKSVLNQTFQDFEIIIVDDASTDNTAEVVSSFHDERIKIFHRDVSGGDAVARNLGIKNSEGEYIALLDDDDEWVPEKLEQQTNLFLNNDSDVGVVYTGVMYISGNNGEKLYEPFSKKGEDFFNAILSMNTVNTSSVMIRKACFNQLGLFDENFPCGSDHDMWIRIARKFRFECIDSPLTKYRIHEKKLSTKFDLVIEGKEKILEKHEQWYKKIPKILSERYLDIGILYCLNGMSSKGRQVNLKAILLNPFNVKPYFLFVMSCLGTSVFRKMTELNNRLNENKNKRTF